MEVKQFIIKDVSKKFNISLQMLEKIIGTSSFVDSNLEHTILNHPVHIIDTSGVLSPSALIPFCKFGNWIGVKIDKIDVPVCDIFQAKILNDQLCYEVDPNKFSDSTKMTGFTFYVDTNNDRQIYSRDSDFSIYLNTLGKN